MKSINRMIAMAVLVTPVFLMVACGTSTPPPPTTPSSTYALSPTTMTIPSTPTQAPTSTHTITPLPTATRTLFPTVTYTPTPSAKDMLIAAFDSALSKLRTYRAKIPEESREIDVILPDRFAQLGWDPIVKIGGMVYLYDARGNLRVGPADSIPFFDRVNIFWLRDRFAESPQIVLLGPATVENTPCIGYSGSFALSKITPSKTPGATPEITQMWQTVKIWFATSDGFPRRVEMGAPVPVTIIFFDFNVELPPIEPLR